MKERYFLENNIVTNKQAEEMGVQRHVLASLAQRGELERIKNGVYKRKDALDDDFANIYLKNQQVVFSFHTALYLHGFNDRTPNTFHISVPQGYNAGHIKRKFPLVRVHYIERKLFPVGIIQKETPVGSVVSCYNMERCICDIVLKRKYIDKQLFTDAIKGYFGSKNKNVNELVKYSKILGIENEIRKYVEIM
ncbi:hypothetical protein KJY78_03645 [Canibacter sp. lx-45]|uniref:type IV toxin-antitoxin system AbiEi family antitoxin domain-containing protein n=1 Tax=Canibacter zhuwentaonis TaxID=2837491 RepID=UPI001BDC0048|nr:type IV toxin-antitoxin system AbiEi family antitoxin domain-containing protein [Canibacter zhuwentaonis]MBT1035444.1 hypothetical protein [Canibacter zhuwentaonis]